MGEQYADPGATCTDNVDGDKAATADRTVDTGTPGQHVITYSCSDEAGNDAVELSRVVLVRGFGLLT